MQIGKYWEMIRKDWSLSMALFFTAMAFVEKLIWPAMGLPFSLVGLKDILAIALIAVFVSLAKNLVDRSPDKTRDLIKDTWLGYNVLIIATIVAPIASYFAGILPF